MPESYEGLKKNSEQRLKLINEFIQSQFQPLAFSIETNPLLSAFMHQYIGPLRGYTSSIAYLFWEMAGYQEGLTDRYWLGAQKYVDSLGVWATALSSSQETSFNDSFRMLMEAVPPQRYVDIVGKLAQEMWMNAGHPSQSWDFWGWAENYTLKTATQAIANAKTAFEASDSLKRMFADPRRMFAGARRMFAGTRDYIWETLGEPRGHSMDDWLQAEKYQALTL